MKSFFTPKEISKIIGISYRQLQYWDKTRLIQPSYRRRGKYRLYTFSDALQMRVARKLRDVNVSIQKIRRIIALVPELLKQLRGPLRESAFLVDPGNDHVKPAVILFEGAAYANAQALLKFVRIDARELVVDIEQAWPDELAMPPLQETA